MSASLSEMVNKQNQILMLKEHEKKFSAMLQDVPLASVMLNAEWKVVFANRFFLQLTGYQEEEIVESDWVDTFIPEDKRAKTRNTNELISAALVEIAPYMETQILTKSGKKVQIGFNNTLMKDSNGIFLGVSCVGEDLDAKRAKQLSASNCTRKNEAHHSHDSECMLLKNYEAKEPETSVTGDMLGDLVLVKVLKNLGSDIGHVQLAVHKDTKEKVAVKTMRKDLMKPEEIERARREIEIMQQLTKLNNPYIIKLIDFEETVTDFHLVIEYLCGGELVALILKNNGLSEGHVHRLFKQLLCAIECCHQNSIVHRDIKLQNILLDADNNIKLIDFGLSNFVEVGRFRSTFCGTPAYAPPEILLGTSYRGPEVDMWSLGVVLYSMLTAEFPFTTIGDILKGVFKEPNGITSDCLDLLKKLLTVKKEARATLEEVLKHPWILKSPEDFKSEGECCDDCTSSPVAKKRKI